MTKENGAKPAMTDATVIEELDHSQRETLDEEIRKWEEIAGSVDRKAVEEAIASLYDSVGVQAPPVLWCESAGQLVATKVLLFFTACDTRGVTKAIF